MSLFHSSYIRWFISAHLLLGKGVDKSSKESIRVAVERAQINRSVVIDIPTFQSVLRGELPLPKQQLPQPPAIVPVLLSAMPALSPAVLAQPPVDGLDDWTISSNMSNFPLNNDENDMIIEIVAEEDYMYVEDVVPVESVATENDMELVPV